MLRCSWLVTTSTQIPVDSLHKEQRLADLPPICFLQADGPATRVHTAEVADRHRADHRRPQ
jgi:hypothetical protein